MDELLERVEALKRAVEQRLDEAQRDLTHATEAIRSMEEELNLRPTWRKELDAAEEEIRHLRKELAERQRTVETRDAELAILHRAVEDYRQMEVARQAERGVSVPRPAPQQPLPMGIADFQRMAVVRSAAVFASSATWTPLEWAGALAGEVGELANLLKKRRRGDAIPQQRLAEELGDVMAYLVLVAASVEVDLEHATVAKFEEVSRRHGYTVRLTDGLRTELARAWDVVNGWEESFLRALSVLRVVADLSANAVANYVGSGMTGADVVRAERWEIRPESHKLVRMRDAVLSSLAGLTKRPYRLFGNPLPASTFLNLLQGYEGMVLRVTFPPAAHGERRHDVELHTSASVSDDLAALVSTAVQRALEAGVQE